MQTQDQSRFAIASFRSIQVSSGVRRIVGGESPHFGVARQPAKEFRDRYYLYERPLAFYNEKGSLQFPPMLFYILAETQGLTLP